MRENLTEEEKNYIKVNIIMPLETDFNKVHLCATGNRAQIMLETSLKRIKFDPSYEARISIRQMPNNDCFILFEGKRKGCQEILMYTVPLK